MIFAIAGLQLLSGLLKRRCFDELIGVTYRNNNIFPEIICNGTNDCPGGFICGRQTSNPDFGVTNFDNLYSAFLMVFQVSTMEGWALIMLNVQRAFSSVIIIFFLMIVFIGNFF